MLFCFREISLIYYDKQNEKHPYEKKGKLWCQVGLKPMPLAVWANALQSRPLTPPFSSGSYPRHSYLCIKSIRVLHNFIAFVLKKESHNIMPTQFQI